MKTIVIAFVTAAVIIGITCVVYFVKKERLTEPAVEKIKQEYSQQELEYFSMIAFSSNSSLFGRVIHRWNKPEVRFKIMTEASDREKQEVSRVLDDINKIVLHTHFRLSAEAPDVEIHFVPKREVNKVIYGSKGSNNGAFGYSTNLSGEIVHARIAVAKDLSLEGWEEAIIREEISQSLGLPVDTDMYEKSVFSSDKRIVINDLSKSTFSYFTTQFLDIDKKVISILYNTGLPCNLSEEEFKSKVFKSNK